MTVTSSPSRQRSDTPGMIDIVIPVYRGYTETRECIESVLRHTAAGSFELILVNDASPEDEVNAYLEEVGGQGLATLICNQDNKGFAGSVNLCMGLHPDRDVLLLNSDTRVHGDWLRRLQDCAWRATDTCTATPFTNNGTVCGYPRAPQSNDLPTDTPLEQLDTLCSRVNRGLSVELPTAVGFCMYIRRDCLDQVGLFDERGFPRGYGEEVDFSRKAAELGLRHLLCADVFVQHHGAASFAEDSDGLNAQAQAVVNGRYPDYAAMVNAFLREDPADILRQRVHCERIRVSPRPCLLFVSHNMGGGTERHLQDLAALLAGEYEVLILRPHRGHAVVLEWTREPGSLALYFHLPMQYERLQELLDYLQVQRIHYHHLIGHHPCLFSLPRKLDLPYDYTVHDYHCICPRYSLARQDGRYCGEPDETACANCIKDLTLDWPLGIASWRAQYKSFVEAAQRVIVPSTYVAERISRHYPAAPIQVWGHPETERLRHLPRPTAGNGYCKLLVLGALSREKGIGLLEACARDAHERGLPLLFRLLGEAKEAVVQWPQLPLSVAGPYEPRALADLLRMERADMIFFPCTWPETYSYTLSEAMQTGLPIAAPNLGAFTERLAAYPRVLLVDWDLGPGEWNERLLAFARVRGIVPMMEKSADDT